ISLRRAPAVHAGRSGKEPLLGTSIGEPPGQSAVQVTSTVTRHPTLVDSPKDPDPVGLLLGPISTLPARPIDAGRVGRSAGRCLVHPRVPPGPGPGAYYGHAQPLGHPHLLGTPFVSRSAGSLPGQTVRGRKAVLHRERPRRLRG